MNVITGQTYLTEDAIKAAKERGEPIAMLEGILSEIPVSKFTDDLQKFSSFTDDAEDYKPLTHKALVKK